MGGDVMLEFGALSRCNQWLWALYFTFRILQQFAWAESNPDKMWGLSH